MGNVHDVLQRFTDAFNAHDADAMRSFYTDESVFTAPGGVELRGADAIVEYAQTWLRAFPDGTQTTHTEVVGDGWAATQFTFTGTHTETLASPDGDVPATGRTLSGRGAEVLRIEGGKVLEDHLYFDQMDVMTQLGLVPEAAATA